MSERKWSCNSHPRRTEFDCARCGFQQVDTLRTMLTETQDALKEACDIASSRLEILGMADHATPGEMIRINELRKLIDNE